MENKNTQNNLFNELTSNGIGSNTEIVTGTGLTRSNTNTFGNVAPNQGESFSDDEEKIITLLEQGYDNDFITQQYGVSEDEIAKIVSAYENKEKYHR